MARGLICIVILFSLVGCSDSSDQNGKSWQVDTENPGRKKLSFLEETKAKIKMGGQALKSAQEIFEKQPEALNILKGNSSKKDWQSLDKSYLKEKGLEFKKMFEESGLSVDQELSSTDRMLLGEIGKRLGISPERAAQLEQKIRAKAGTVDGNNLSVRKTTPAQTLPALSGSRQSSGVFDLLSGSTSQDDDSNASDELKAIIKRRKERLAAATNPVPTQPQRPSDGN